MIGEVALMPHQIEGIAFLVQKKCGLLAFEQGLGKTLIAIKAFQQLLGEGRVKRLVVICPNSLKKNWAEEIKRFAPELEACIVEGNASQRRTLLAQNNSPFLIVNYEAARNEITGLCAALLRTRCALTFDESHNVKNLRSLNSIATKHFTPLAEYRWLLSGTPVTNRPIDIYSQIAVVDPGHHLGSPEVFELNYGDAGNLPDQRRRLNGVIQPYILRRTKKECLTLPSKRFVDIRVVLPDWQRELYDAIRDGLIEEVKQMTEDEFRRFVSGTALIRLLRLSQVASNPALIFREEKRIAGKTIELDALIQRVAPVEKVILWSTYVETIKALAVRYAPYGVVTLFGEVPTSERQNIAHRFQTDDATRLLIANPAAAGTGFTLTAASYTIYESLNWRYDLYAQSQDRNHRIGQDKTVTYIRLIAQDTIEEAIIATLERKDRMAQEIVSGLFVGEPISNMSREAFCELVLRGRVCDPLPSRRNGGT
jgi:SNF2 family DNA or RNA helicase